MSNLLNDMRVVLDYADDPIRLRKNIFSEIVKEWDALIAERDEVLDALEEAIEHLELAPIEYSNGVTDPTGAMDEGEFYGWKAHEKLLKKLHAVSAKIKNLNELRSENDVLKKEIETWKMIEYKYRLENVKLEKEIGAYEHAYNRMGELPSQRIHEILDELDKTLAKIEQIHKE